jgi:hypothetical protein
MASAQGFCAVRHRAHEIGEIVYVRLVEAAADRYAAEFVDSIHQAENSSIAQEVRRSIYRLLPLGNASISRVANSLGCTRGHCSAGWQLMTRNFRICSMMSAANLP